MSSKVQKIVICGGGNGAHVLASILSSRENTETNVLTLYQDEAEIWNKAMENGMLYCLLPNESEIRSRPNKISKNPADVVPGANIILITVPAFSHEEYLRAIEPYIRYRTIIVGFPGLPGFEFQARHILKAKSQFVSVLSATTFPWACRIVEYGRNVKIIGVKNYVDVAVIQDSSKGAFNPLELLQSVLGSPPVFNKTNHFLEHSLMFAVVHPGLMYGRWKYWDGIPLSEKPLFYQGTDDFQAKCVTDLDDEVQGIAKEISKRTGVDFRGCLPMHTWLVKSYGSAISNPCSLKTALVTNKAYEGMVHPMKEVKGGYVPDFKHRYLSEDVPFGLVVVKGLAKIVGLKTPVIDELIRWGQQKLGKVFIEGTELTGGHLFETRAPQVYGITSLKDLRAMMGL
ncbi:opine dehydrogenase-like [Haliotis rufescens]|uniref:opine dehydrogenase-like n=1 Tax=Haliotis rufescens TaxID=6454 RepID=UPI00201F19DD|nr:opine dehydrogenase-like [Haliotis rufescens]